ncbi:hypothetical protein C8Q80DRAFT_900754 [Daedaleopsis nitida]|nr:hypothetical protein C8Q80DRAFT_900754 [Daedaleopsis nitida]
MRSSTYLSGPAPTLRYYVVLLLALFSFFESTLAVSIAFQTALMKDFPNVIQCETNFDILWKGGASPWTVTITDATTDDIVQKATVYLSSFEWLPNRKVGSTGQITITDANQEQVTSPYTIVSNPKGDNLCALASTPLTSPNNPLSSPSESSLSSSGPSATDTSRDSNISTPTVHPASGISPTSGPHSSSSPGPQTLIPPVSTSVTSQSTRASDLSSGTTAGIVIGVIAFVFACGSLGVVYHLRRRSHRRGIHPFKDEHQCRGREEPDLERRGSLASLCHGTAEHTLSAGGSPLQSAQHPRTSSLAVELSRWDAESSLAPPPSRQSHAPPLPRHTSSTTPPEKTAGDSDPGSMVQTSPTPPLSTRTPQSAPNSPPSPPDPVLIRAAVLDFLRTLSSGQRRRLIGEELDMQDDGRQRRVEADGGRQLFHPVLGDVRPGPVSDDSHSLASYSSTLPPPYTPSRIASVVD